MTGAMVATVGPEGESVWQLGPWGAASRTIKTPGDLLSIEATNETNLGAKSPLNLLLEKKLS